MWAKGIDSGRATNQVRFYTHPASITRAVVEPMLRSVASLEMDTGTPAARSFRRSCSSCSRHLNGID
jgi:hypothetical protein